MCTLLGGVDISDFSEQISEQSGHAISFSCTGNVAKVGKWCFSKIYSTWRKDFMKRWVWELVRLHNTDSSLNENVSESLTPIYSDSIWKSYIQMSPKWLV